MTGPIIGQRVLLSTLVRPGKFPGVIVGITAFTGLCVVKLDRQDRVVKGVKYFAEPPTVVDGRYWQICYPDPQHKEEVQ